MSELRTVAHYQKQAIEGLQLQVERLQEQLDAITGDQQKSMITLSAGGVDFPVMYEFEEGEAAIYDVNSPVCGPGSPPTVTSMEVWVNGGWMNVDDFLRADLIARWEDWIVEHEQGNEVARREEYLMEKADQARQDRIERDYK
jgi:hypothetical protein